MSFPYKDFIRQFEVSLYYLINGSPIAGEKIRAVHINTTEEVLDRIVKKKLLHKDTRAFVKTVKSILFGEYNKNIRIEGIEGISNSVDICLNKKLNENTIVLIQDSVFMAKDATFEVDVGSSDDEAGVDAVVDGTVINLFGDKRDGESN